MDERMLTAKELAERWNVSVYKIHRLANKKNGLKAYKIGNSTRFKPSDVEAYLAANEIVPQDKPENFSCARITYKPGMKVVSL